MPPSMEVRKLDESQGSTSGAGMLAQPSLHEQREMISKTCDEAQPMTLGDVHCAVAMRWWINWKRYVDYGALKLKAELDVEVLNQHQPHPGPIDNSKLQSKDSELELSQEVFLEGDYIMLPETAYVALKEWYGGGPTFKRRVVERGYYQQLQIDLYPYFLHLSTVQSIQQLETDQELKLEPLMLDSPRSVNDAISQVYISLSQPQDSSRRLYLVADPKQTSTTASLTAKHSRPSWAEGGLLKGAFQTKKEGPRLSEEEGRKPLRLQKVEPADHGDQKLEDVFYLNRSLRLVLENRSWRDNLAAGHCIDAQDDHNEWYEAIVMERLPGTALMPDPPDVLHVHFRCWKSCFDVFRDVQSEQIQPLFTVTSPWRNFHVGMELAVQDGKWFPAQVTEVLEADKAVKVSRPSTIAKEGTLEMTLPMESDRLCPPCIHTDKDVPREAYVARAVVVHDMLGQGNVSRRISGDPRESRSRFIKEEEDEEVSLLDSKGRQLVGGKVVEGPGRTLSGNNVLNPSSVDSFSGYGRSPFSERTATKKEDGQQGMVQGAVGLTNLGNTCFMNSMLQCLSNTEVLTQYFLTDAYRRDINVDNPLGMGGRLAVEYAKLMKDMWSGRYVSVMPKEFKQHIGRFAPQFAGYQQHDSQELMSFVLDGLHEDLNRVRQKPYVEARDYAGEPDAQLSGEAWHRHLLRNDSIIVDRCQGQLKSHVTCPKCQLHSITFDPYLSLSLPVPSKMRRTLEFVWFPLPLGTRPRTCVASLLVTSTVRHLKEWIRDHLARSMGKEEGREEGTDGEWMVVDKEGDLQRVEEERVDAETIEIADIYDHKISEVFPSSEPINRLFKPWIKLHAYQLEHRAGPSLPPPPPSSTSSTGPPPHSLTLNLLYARPHRAFMGRSGLLAHPYRLSVCSTDTNGQLWQKVEESAQRWVKRKDALVCLLGIVEGREVEVQDDDELIDVHKVRGGLIAVVDVEVEEGCVDLEEAMQVGSLERGMQVDCEREEKGREEPRLEECLDKFLEMEQLGEEDPWYCGRCRERLRAYKKLDIWSVPDVLILHLKRFSYTSVGGTVSRDKLNDFVRFPITSLDLREYVRGPVDAEAPPIYNLYAVSEHVGELGGGHYTACAQNWTAGKWFEFNDSSVYPLGEGLEERVVSNRAYVLFYRRQKGSLRWAGAEPQEGPGPTTAVKNFTEDFEEEEEN